MAKTELSHDEIVWLMNELRHSSVKWSGRREALRRARRRVVVGKQKSGAPSYKYHWQCGNCSFWYRNEKEVEVDHIIEVGPYCGDWNRYILRVFCGQDNLQVLCTVCHMKKTNQYNSARTRWKRKPRA